MLGDLPFAANPGVCGLDGWNHADLLQTLRKVDWLLETPDITVCCPGHGYCVSAQSMREKLRLMEAEASNLTNVPLLGTTNVTYQVWGIRRRPHELAAPCSDLHCRPGSQTRLQGLKGR